MITDLTSLVTPSTLKKYRKIFTNILNNVREERDSRYSTK